MHGPRAQRFVYARWAGALALAVLLVGCSGQDAGSQPAPSTVTVASAEPRVSSSPTSVPSETAGQSKPPSPEPDMLTSPDVLPTIVPDSLATVVTSDLVVRSLPEIGDESTIHPTYLQDGQDLFVLAGPVVADNHRWYQVVPLDPPPTNDVAPAEPLPRIGWVAAGMPSDLWIAPWSGECPPPNLAGIWRQRALELLACFGDRELTLEGERVQCSYVVPGFTTPSWLSTEFCELLPFGLPPDAHDLGRITFSYHQNRASPFTTIESVPVRVVGHFDDPAAQTCAENPMAGGEPTPPELVVLRCRSAFVATDITEIDRPAP
jgi:hypothetical protein